MGLMAMIKNKAGSVADGAPLLSTGRQRGHPAKKKFRTFYGDNFVRNRRPRTQSA